MAWSMTGCGEGVAADGPSSCRVELRSVNNRFFKLSLRTREGYSGLEGQAEAVIRRRVRRGAVQMTLDLSGPAVQPGRRLDAVQLGAYLDAWQDFCAAHDLPSPLAVDALLGLPGILVDVPPDADSVQQAWPLVSRALELALDGLDRMRKAEGDALAADMRGACAEIRSLADGIRRRVPEVVTAHRERLVERINRLLADRGTTVSEADLAREVALAADRSDIAEELVRLESHVAQFDRLLDDESPGRALDFLAQELGREANTIASKSLDVDIAHAVVEIKARIERLREQAQNVE
jgi:uncharacterized protein (TIGR00255 family)